MTGSSRPEVSAVKLALLAAELRRQSDTILNADPIAIIGMACRVPGADSVEGYWDLLREGRNATREVPSDRWDAASWFDADPSAPGKMVTTRGAFLDRIDLFDADYFGILAREAERMDPQQRLVLEVAIDALDQAGLTRSALAGQPAGVYIASYFNDYAQLQFEQPTTIDARTLTGTLHSIVANRLSFLLDLKGPSLSLDTACSSSLVAIHLACQSLRAGETTVGIAGGVSVIVGPEMMVAESKVGFMAPDGRCKTFDASADGFGRGEGCGIVVLKRLADAIADGDRILAVIRGSAINQDGRSTVLAAPNGMAQQALIRTALANARVDPARIGLAETHGTGTQLGDPIEVEALAATIGTRQSGASTCYLGAAKANIGHLEAAAGVAGLIKAVLCLCHEIIPPQVGFARLNPHITLEGTRLAVPTTSIPWPRGDRLRCATTSSFGVGGTNAHVIIEEAPPLPAPPSSPSTQGRARMLPLSARSPEALRALVARWTDFLDHEPDDIVDLSWTAAQRRTHYEHRLAVVGRSGREWQEALRRAQATDSAPSAASGPHTATRLAFVFSGQGPQSPGMGGELLEAEPVFRQSIEETDALFRSLAGWSLREELLQPESQSRLQQTEFAQPTIFALQVALASLWKSWGILPAAVVGHSVGEIAALHVAGVLSLEQAVEVVWHRGRIMQAATGHGRMVSAHLALDQAVELIRPVRDRASVAAINSPGSVVLSGDTAIIDQLVASLVAGGTPHRMLPVDYAFHSPQMAPFQQRLAEALTHLRTRPSSVPVYSTVTGGLVTAPIFDGEYFGRNVRETVAFASAIDAMFGDGLDGFVEIAPHPVLGGSIVECLEHRNGLAPVVASLRRGKPERETMLQACATLYGAGLDPSWSELDPDAGQVVSLPSYPWQHQRYWLTRSPSRGSSRENSSGHPLLGRRTSVAGSTTVVFEGNARPAAHWLVDHRIAGKLLLPGAAVMEAFVAAAAIVSNDQVTTLAGFVMHRPLVLSESGGDADRWQVVVNPRNSGSLELAWYATQSDDSGEWIKIATATAELSDGPLSRAGRIEGGQAVAPPDIYQRYHESGVAFGPCFRTLREIRWTGDAVEALLELPDVLDQETGYRIHPVLLDGALQTCVVSALSSGVTSGSSVLLPLGADRIRVLGTVEPRVRVVARVRREGTAAGLTADISIETPDGRPVAAIEGMRFAPSSGPLVPPAPIDKLLYDITWTAVSELPAVTDAVRLPGDWLVFVDGSDLSQQLAARLDRMGGRCHLVEAGFDFARDTGLRWRLDPSDRTHLDRLFTEAGWSSDAAPRGIVHLWNLELASLTLASPSLVDREDALGVGSLLHLAQTLTLKGVRAPLIVVTRGAHVVTGTEEPGSLRPRAAGAWGMADVIAAEDEGVDVRRIDLAPIPEPDELDRLVAEIIAPAGERRRVAHRGRDRLVPSLVPRRVTTPTGPDRPGKLQVVKQGTLDGLELVPSVRTMPGPGEVRISIGASGLNFRDVLFALGMYPGGDVPLGVECAGVVAEVGPLTPGFSVGDRVFGFAPGSLATEVVAPAAFIAKIPAELDDASAATIPIAYLTALYGLDRLAGMKAGDRVLIHAAAGGVGMAAVHLARRAGAEVFATAGSIEKRELLRALGVQHVMDSRSLDFGAQIREITDGAGVDIVLNSLAGDFIGASLATLAKGGRFLELGKRDVMTVAEVAATRPDVRYHLYDLGMAAMADATLLRPMLDELIDALADGSIGPLPYRTFPLTEAREAFRFMAQARHVGKIVLVPTQGPTPVSIGSNASYLVSGGLGALGIDTARWLVTRGARTVVLTGRHAPGREAAAAIAELTSAGADVRVMTADAGDSAAMEQVLGTIGATLPPLRGVIHAAGVLADGVIERQTWEQCRALLRGKAHGAWILDYLTRDLGLDFFILYSAAGALLGAPGQGVYPAANLELDALARARSRAGLPALSVAWGKWAGGGMAGTIEVGHDQWASRGLVAIQPDQGFAALERLLGDRKPHGAVLAIDWRRFLTRPPAGVEAEYFQAVASRATLESKGTAAASASDLASRLRRLPKSDQKSALESHLIQAARQAIGLPDRARIDPTAALRDLGLDSLMAVELRNALSRSVAHQLPATLLFDYPTIDKLTEYLAKTLDLGPTRVAVKPVEAKAIGAADDLSALSDDEATALLLAELDPPSAGS